MQLTERQESILKSVIETYVATAHPVGSAAVVSSSGLPFSSATVRHELAALEEMGYLRQPHTSGGRVPTDAGYRYYVEHLVEPRPLARGEAQAIKRQLQGARRELPDWLKLAAAVMASQMHNVGLVTAPKPPEFRLRHVEIIAMHDRVALLIAVLQNGSILQEMLTLDQPSSQEQLSARADHLSHQLQGLTAREIEARADGYGPEDAMLARLAAQLLRRSEEQDTEIYHAGLAELIGQPEFLWPQHGEPAGATNLRLRHMVEFLHGGLASRLLTGLSPGGEVRVVLGGEVVPQGLDGYSFVLGQYGGGWSSSGFLGIVGPTRLEYPRAISLVRYMTDLMTDLVQAG